MGIRFLATLAAFSLVFTGTAVADDERVDRKIVQEGLDEITTKGAQGVQLRVHAERDRFTARSGTAELNGRPVPLNGRFRAGSIAKTFTATVVLQLVGEGRVSLDSPIDRYLPGLVDNRITVRQLLQMTSGLYNYSDSISFDPQGFEPIRFRSWAPEELVAISTSKPLQAEPGTKYEYNNTNYVVLGLLIEKTTGRTWEKSVEQRILKPLHLNETTLPGNSAEIRGPHAHSYGLVDGKTVDTTRWNPSVFWSAGAIISTTRDLDTFYTALIGGKLLRPAQQAELTRTTTVSPGYGLGLFVEKLSCGATILGHPGSVPGFASYAYTTADLKRRAEFSATASTAQGDPTAAYWKVINEVFC